MERFLNPNVALSKLDHGNMDLVSSFGPRDLFRNGLDSRAQSKKTRVSTWMLSHGSVQTLT